MRYDKRAAAQYPSACRRAEAVSRLGIASSAALPALDKVATAWLDLAKSGNLRPLELLRFRAAPPDSVWRLLVTLSAFDGARHRASADLVVARPGDY